MDKSSTRGLAVVTGATGGIGKAVCWQLHHDGFAIVAQYNENHEKANQLAASIQSEGGICHTVSANLSTESGIERCLDSVEQIVEANQSVDIRALVNNAAKLLGPSFNEAVPSQFDEYFALNTKAPFFLSQQLSRKMAAGGSIVNISSAGAHFSSPGDIVYAMTKAALESMTMNMAEALAGSGIRVNSVIPGFTDNGHDAFRIPEIHAYMSSFAVLGGVSLPKTVADAVSFLISDKAKRTTGTSLDVSGGSTIGARGSRGSSVHALLDGN